jgi:hypothetical protein
MAGHLPHGGESPHGPGRLPQRFCRSRYQDPGGLIGIHAACERFGCGRDPQPVIAAFRAAFWKRQIW